NSSLLAGYVEPCNQYINRKRVIKR
ncbi:oxygen-insensitive NAD(P)H nitroreductase domain protein, partial [Vibrio parahaemolyticus AQ3810]